MAEFDWIMVLLPVFLSAIVTFIVLAINRFNKTSEGTLSGTIRLEHVQTNLDGLEQKMDKGFEKIEDLIKFQDRETRDAFNKVWTRFEEINTDIKLHEYRLNAVDQNRRRYSNGAVDNGEHK